MRKYGGFVATVVLLVLFAFASPASAATATLDKNHVPPGGVIKVSATGFKAGSMVDISSRGTILAQATADSAGAITDVTITPFCCIGINRVHLFGIRDDGTAYIPTAVFSITPSSGTASSLPRTGRDMTGLVVLGLGCIAVGGLIVGRRRIASRFGTKPLLAGGALLLLAGGTLVAGPALAQTSGTGSISGKVSNSSSTGLPNICVHVASANNFGAAVTDASGNYTISNLPNDTYTVRAADCTSPPSYMDGFGPNVTTSGAAFPGANMTLTQGGIMGGRVSDAADNTKGVTALVWTGPDANSLSSLLTSGREGSYETDPLTAGQYVVAFLPTDGSHALQYFGNTNDSASSTKATIAAGAVSIAGARVPTAGTIGGTVTDAASGGSPTRTVCVYDRTSDIRTLVSGFVTAAGPGTYSLAGLSPGNHKVEFADCGGSSGSTAYTTQFFNTKPDVATADPVAVAASGTANNTNAAMTTGEVTSTSSTTSTTVAGGGGGGGASSSTSTSTTAPASTGAAGVSTTTAAPGGGVTVTGGGFKPGTGVDVVVFSDPIKLTTVLADAAGNISARVTLPTTLAAGTHTLQLQGINPNGTPRVLSATITVSGTLAATGPSQPISNTAALGIVFLGFGAVLMNLSRRRYHHRPPGLYIGY